MISREKERQYFFYHLAELLLVVKFTIRRICFFYSLLFLINCFLVLKKDQLERKKKMWESHAKIWLAIKTGRKCDKVQTKRSILKTGRQIIVEGREIKIAEESCPKRREFVLATWPRCAKFVHTSRLHCTGTVSRVIHFSMGLFCHISSRFVTVFPEQDR